MGRFSAYITMMCIATLATTASTSYTYAKSDKAESFPSEETYTYLNLFGEVFERIKANYVEDVKDKKLIESAINGMLTSLDPHSSYLDAESFKDMQVQTKGEFGGLGIEVTLEGGFVKVVSPIDGTPADKAGIKAGDFITEINGGQVLGMTLQEAVEKMRGKVGEKIKLTVHRADMKEPLNLTLERAVIEIKAVRAGEYKDVGYVRITTFNENTYKDLVTAITKIKKDIPKIKGYVIDLRNNPGGLLDQAEAVSDAFLERGEIVSTRSRGNEKIDSFQATAGDITEGKPIVVIINGGSASASEIVSGALKEHRRAVIIGTKSFGKGSVQSIMPLANGEGALRLTTARYYTPSGASIQAKGIEPDIEIASGELNIKENKNKLSEESLPHHLRNEQTRQRKLKESKTQKEKSDTGIDIFKQENVDKDIQLKNAFDVMQAMPIMQEMITSNTQKTSKEIVTIPKSDEKK